MRWGRAFALAAPSLLALAVHVHVIRARPVVRIWGDERTYLSWAVLLCDDRAAGLVPGRMVFELWPPLGYHVLAAVVPCTLAPEASRARVRELVARGTGTPVSLRTQPELRALFDVPLAPASVAESVRRAAAVHLALLLALGGIAALACSLVGGGASASALGAFFVIANPRLGFYVTSLWPEIVHACLLLGGLVALAGAQRLAGRGAVAAAALALVSGALLGYAALAKGIAGSFFWIACLLLAGAAALRVRAERAQALRLVALLALFAVGFHAVVVPQRLANLRRHGSTAIGANFWLNVEIGLAAGEQRKKDVRHAYHASCSDYVDCERRSRERVAAYLRGADPGKLARRMAKKVEAEVRYSLLARGLHEGRWQGVDPQTPAARALLAWSQALNPALLAGALLQLVLVRPRRFAAVLLAAFGLYYTAGLAVVISNPRMLEPLLPIAAVFAACGVEAAARGVARFSRRWTSPAPSG